MGLKWRERERHKDTRAGIIRAREANGEPGEITTTTSNKSKFNPIVWDLDDSKTIGSVTHQASISQPQEAGPSSHPFLSRFGPNLPNSPATLKPSPPNESNAYASSLSHAAMGVRLRGKGYTIPRWAEANPHSLEQNSYHLLQAPRVHENIGISVDMELESELEEVELTGTSLQLQYYRAMSMLKRCRSVDEYEKLNHIGEGTYGVVYRARDKKTGELVAIKKEKMEVEKGGFPMTALREINILLSLHHHPSIVDVKEVVVGNTLNDVFMVMEYMEHDLMDLMKKTMKQQPFSQSEVKCLMLQLLDGVNYLHDNWILHRDLKTSNLLLNNRGELKICDFGLARQYGGLLKEYTNEVVTLWYRAPELLLGAKKYSTPVDMWSCGCIMAELLAKEPLFPGRSVLDEIDKIFAVLGTPNEKIWPDFVKLPGVKGRFKEQPLNKLKEKFLATTFEGRPTLSYKGLDLLNRLLTYDPLKRITAQEALNHEWFREVPLPKAKEFMSTFPARISEQGRIRSRRLLNL